MEHDRFLTTHKYTAGNSEASNSSFSLIKSVQQVEGGDSPAVLCSGEPPPGALRSALGTPEEERHGPVGVRPEEGDENDQRAGTPLL